MFLYTFDMNIKQTIFSSWVSFKCQVGVRFGLGYIFLVGNCGRKSSLSISGCHFPLVWPIYCRFHTLSCSHFLSLPDYKKGSFKRSLEVSLIKYISQSNKGNVTAKDSVTSLYFRLDNFAVMGDGGHFPKGSQNIHLR